jgi:hypothetical protein
MNATCIMAIEAPGSPLNLAGRRVGAHASSLFRHLTSLLLTRDLWPRRSVRAASVDLRVAVALRRIRVLVRRLVTAGAGPDPISVHVARVTASRWVIVPLAPIGFAAATAAAITAPTQRVDDHIPRRTKAAMLQTTLMPSRPARFATIPATAATTATGLAAARRFAAARSSAFARIATLRARARLPGKFALAFASEALAGELAAIGAARAAAAAARLTGTIDLAAAPDLTATFNLTAAVNLRAARAIAAWLASTGRVASAACLVSAAATNSAVIIRATEQVAQTVTVSDRTDQQQRSSEYNWRQTFSHLRCPKRKRTRRAMEST